jgi:hypothetical protein
MIQPMPSTPTQASNAPMPSSTPPKKKQIMPDGPIPGENYTSDTRNYPWHRPPEITDMDKAIEASIKQLSTTKGAYGLLNSLQAGVTIVQAADMFVTSGIGMGKWTPDFAILLAGPVARMMEIMAKTAGIKYSLGLDGLPEKTLHYYKRQGEIAKGVTQDMATQAGTALQESKDTIKQPPMPEAKGFMPRRPEPTYKTPATMDTTKF